MLFNFATLVPGALSQNAGAGTELGSVSGFTVNGQRPNSNNMTIDGVANIDTGDNGGNMATTNIDAVAEFKMLTNSYQAEYGRAVGGQLQVVTKSGTQAFHGSGYWYGRRPGWNANYWTEQPRRSAGPRRTRATTGATRSAGRSFRSSRSCSSSGARSSRRRFTPPNIRFATVPTALERQGDFSQSVDSSGNPFPYIRDSTTGLPCSAGQYERVLPGRRRPRPDSREPRLLARPEHAQALPAGDRQLRWRGRTSRARSRTRRRVARI